MHAGVNVEIAHDMERQRGAMVTQDRLAATIAAQAPGMTNADAANLLQIVIRTIAAEIRVSGDATIGGLGRFRVVHRPAKRCYIPSAKEVRLIPASTVLRMTPSKHFAHRCIDAEA